MSRSGVRGSHDITQGPSSPCREESAPNDNITGIPMATSTYGPFFFLEYLCVFLPRAPGPMPVHFTSSQCPGLSHSGPGARASATAPWPGRRNAAIRNPPIPRPHMHPAAAHGACMAAAADPFHPFFVMRIILT